MPRKALPRKQANVDTGHPCFSVVAQARAKILPRLAQGSCQVKELDRTTKANAEMNADWKVDKAQYAEFNVPTCSAVETKTWAFLGSQGAIQILCPANDLKLGSTCHIQVFSTGLILA